MINHPIRIGILGAAKIAPMAVIKPAADNENAVVQSVAARSKARAEIYANTHGIPHVAEDYASLIAREDIDLIYVPLPPAQHLHWTLEAVRAGKHVLCEKPFALNAHEAVQMVEAGKRHNRHVIEAFHYRFHPLYRRLQELVEELGAIRKFSAKFHAPILNRKDELRYIPHLGGGALMDLGCYPVHLCRSILGKEPEVAAAKAQWHKHGVDQAMTATLTFPSGVNAEISCSMKALQIPKITAEIWGESGKLQVNNFVLPHLAHKVRLRTLQRSWKGQVDGKSTYSHQLEHLVSVLRGEEQPVTGGSDSIATMAVIDAIYAAARNAEAQSAPG